MTYGKDSGHRRDVRTEKASAIHAKDPTRYWKLLRVVEEAFRGVTPRVLHNRF